MSGPHRPGALIDRVVRDRVSVDDRAHAAACATCGPLLRRAAAFDDELRRSAGALVTEHLPSGILDTTLTGRPALWVTARRPAPGLATILAAAALLVATTFIALGPGSGPEPTSSPSPTRTERPASTKAPFVERFRPTDAIRTGLAKSDYRCNDGGARASIGPEPYAVARDASVCTAPDSIPEYSAIVIVGEAAGGQVVELVIKAQILGDTTTEKRAALAQAMAAIFEVALIDEGARQNGGSWARAHIPALIRRDTADVTIRNLDFHAELLANGIYYVVVRGATG